MAEDLFVAQLFAFQNFMSTRRKTDIKSAGLQRFMLMNIIRRHRLNVHSAFLTLLDESECKTDLIRTCRRFERHNNGWWMHAWSTYNEKRFKNSFRVTRGTFIYWTVQNVPFKRKLLQKSQLVRTNVWLYFCTAWLEEITCIPLGKCLV